MFKKRKLQGLLAAAMVALLAACGGGGGGGGASGGVAVGGSGNSGIDASSDAKGWGGSGSVAGGGSANGGGGSSAGGTSGGGAGASSGVSVTVGSGGGGSTTYSDGINDLNWSTMNFKVFVNGNLVFDQPISKGDQISMKGVKVGDKIHAEGSFLVAGETEPRTVSGDIPSASGNDKLTLYVGYKYSYPVLDAGGNPTGNVEEGLYTAANPPSPPDVKLLDGRTITGWADSAGNPIPAGTTGDLGELEPVIEGTKLFNVEGTAGVDAKIKGLTDEGKAVTTLVIPEGVTEIGGFNAYSNGPFAFTSISIPSSVKTIAQYAFSSCSNLEGNVTIPDSVENIGHRIFAFCTGITSVTLPSSIKEIGNQVFQGCTGLESVSLPSNITKIGNDMFNGCTSLKSVTIPNGVTKIDYNAFEDCTSLTGITIPESVEEIASAVFKGCNNALFTSITIPANVKKIGKNAFYNSNLQTAEFAVKDGWKAGTQELDASELINKTTAATDLTSMYANREWTRTP